MDSKKIILITGANSGIGYALSKALLQQPNTHVILGCRSATKAATALDSLKATLPPDSTSSAAAVELDISNDESIEAARAHLTATYPRIDVLVNNAAIGGIGVTPVRKAFLDCYNTNVAGTYVLTEALIPLLLGEESKSGTGMEVFAAQHAQTSAPSTGSAPADAASAGSPRSPRIINVSSGQGSIAIKLDVSRPYSNLRGEWYRCTKSALNMVTACFAREYGPRGAKVFSWCPGFVVSNLSSHNTAANGAKDADDSVVALVDVVLGKRDGEAGGFLWEGGVYPW